MTATTSIPEIPGFVSKGEWDLALTVEERFKLLIKERLEKKVRARKNLYRHMNMGCFE